ncbi:hypothetical protein BEWA_019890 [Theileria equi strain WA]|uniref:Uncharacterized protein n=1 Tax=Theileria equi strain WA TaxID=1537102 RepID=L0AV65_THEEQ|nr:hypothetical protein BEWA_019890 [Theileria equi strain WA]AFZ79143.1 hypothetical protein BEWA_019890 [Theileria equi strain WA]|eukprot:XP_004828809.1 hypothetical protein BEWA_019890 [Theileria equi strain WA]
MGSNPNRPNSYSNMNENQLNRPKTRYYVQSQNMNALAAQSSPTRRYVDNGMNNIRQNYQNFLNSANYPLQNVSQVSVPNLQMKQVPVTATIHNPNYPQYGLVGNSVMQGQILSHNPILPTNRQPMVQNQQGSAMFRPTTAAEKHISYPQPNISQNNIQPGLATLSPKPRIILAQGNNPYNLEMTGRTNVTNQIQYTQQANLQAAMNNQMIMNFNKVSNQPFGNQGLPLQSLMSQNPRNSGSIPVMRANFPNNMRTDMYKIPHPKANYNMQYEVASQIMQRPKMGNMRMESKTVNIPTTTSKIKDEELLQFTALEAKRKANDMVSQSVLNDAESVSDDKIQSVSNEVLVESQSSINIQIDLPNPLDFFACIQINKRCKIPDEHKLVSFEYRIPIEHYSLVLKRLRSLYVSTIEYPVYVETDPTDLSLPTDGTEYSTPSETNIAENKSTTYQDKNSEEVKQTDGLEVKCEEEKKCNFIANKIRLEHEKTILPIPIRNYENISHEELEKLLNILNTSDCKILKEHKLTKYRVRTFIHTDGTTQNQFILCSNITNEGTVLNTVLHQFGTFSINNTNKFKTPLFSIIHSGHANPAFLLERGTNQIKKISKTVLQHYQTSRSFDLYCIKNDIHFSVQLSRYSYGINLQSPTFSKFTIMCPANQLPTLLGVLNS